jgi:hypothetical protein
MIYYPNCSELIADFNTHDAKDALQMLTSMAKKYKWVLEPIPTLLYLENMKGKDELPYIKVIDKNGNSTSFEYGSNGYDDSLGYRFDTGCSHYDETQYKFFACAMKEIAADVMAYDGGSTQPFDEWLDKK